MKDNLRKLVIFGIEDFADIAFEYFKYDSDYEVVGFVVDSIFLEEREKFGLPVVTFDEIDKIFPSISHDIFVAIVYARLNRLREEVCERVKQSGYKLASYISSRAFVWRNVKIGEHCFIFENNTIQPYAEIGNNVIIWSGNHIGHHSKIGNHCFISSHVVVSGWCSIGDHCFLGVNSTLANNTGIGNDCWISHNSSISGDVPIKSLVKAASSEITSLNEKVLFKALSLASKSRKF